MGDEAAHVVVGGQAGSPKVELLVARKGSAIWGISDEEYAQRGSGPGAAEKEQKARLSKDEAIAKLKPLLEGGARGPGMGGDAGGPPAGSAAAPGPSPSGASSTPKK